MAAARRLRGLARHLATAASPAAGDASAAEPLEGFGDPRLTWLYDPSGWEDSLPADADTETEGFGGGATVSADGSSLQLRPPAKKDFWRRTYYEPDLIKGDAAALCCSIAPDEEVTIDITFDYNPLEQFDQCGILIYLDESHWLKAGLEWADGGSRLSCVCCNIFSDWSVMDWPATSASLRLHKVNQGRAVVLEAKPADGDESTCEPPLPSPAPHQRILWLASGVSNEGGSSPLLVPLPAVSWPWVPAWGSLEPPRRDGENAQKTRKNGEKMGEIQPKRCEGRELTKDQLAERDRPASALRLGRPFRQSSEEREG